MTLRARIWLVLIIAGVLVAVTAWSLRTGYYNVAESATRVTTQLQPASDTAAGVRAALAEMRGGANSYALTGDTVDLATYLEAQTRLENNFRRLRHYLKGNDELLALLEKTEDAAQAWQDEGAGLIIEAARDGDSAQARRIVRSGTPRMLYNETRVYAFQLDLEIRDEVDDAVAFEESQFVLLWRVLNAAIVLLLILVWAFAFFLFRGVLRPLKDLRRQMVRAAKPAFHETPIQPSGPPELQQLGQDAEQMRRQLVDQIDRARQADEGLVQETPVIAAIRTELYEHHNVVVAGLDLYGEQSPAEGVLAGDWWSAQILHDERLALTMTDVSGHGPAAGIEALRLKHVIELSMAQHGNPALALEAAARGFRDAGRFATCVALVVDPRTGLLMWANAGHHPPWLISAAVTELVPTGPMMSVLGGTWTNHSSQLEPGAMLALWTDGLVESHDADGQELGEDGLLVLVNAALASERTSAGFVKHVLAAARSRSVDWRRDDVTMVAVQRV